MKKTLLALALLAGVASGASAQCTPDTTHFNASTKVYPASQPCIITHQAFAGTVTLQVPDSLDASNFVTGLPAGYAKGYIDSIQIISISGMPAGITTASSPNLGQWLKHGEHSCTIFSGTTAAAAGDYQLTINGTGCGHINYMGAPQSRCQSNFDFTRVYPYKLTVCYPAGVSEVSEGLQLNVYPNPNQGAFTVTVSTADHISGDMMVLDQLGRNISTQAIDVTGTKQIALELGNIAPGAYLLAINTTNGRSVKQFIVK